MTDPMYHPPHHPPQHGYPPPGYQPTYPYPPVPPPAGPRRRSAWTLLLPWGAAAFLFAPRYRLTPEDPLIRQLGRTRAVLGLVAVVGIAVWFGAFSRIGLENVLESLAVTGLLAIPSSLLCMAVVVAFTPAARRGAVVRQLRWPLLSLGAFVVVMAAMLLFNAGGAQVVMGVLGSYNVRIPLDGLVAGGVFGLWFLIFVFRSAYLVSRYWFNAVDGHPYLQPLTAAWMAWVLAVNVLAFQSPDDEVPAAVAVTLPVASALVTTALAALEAQRVRRSLSP